jgi:hypothetical protein
VARLVRRRKGRINRALLFLRPGEPKLMSANSVRAKTRVSGVNYFFALTTIISPDQRQLLFDS